jgi:hypothetical protein
MTRAAPIENVRDISKLAYGFMAAKAMFAALDIDLFTRLESGGKSAAELEAPLAADSCCMISWLMTTVAVRRPPPYGSCMVCCATQKRCC